MSFNQLEGSRPASRQRAVKSSSIAKTYLFFSTWRNHLATRTHC